MWSSFLSLIKLWKQQRNVVTKHPVAISTELLTSRVTCSETYLFQPDRLDGDIIVAIFGAHCIGQLLNPKWFSSIRPSLYDFHRSLMNSNDADGRVFRTRTKSWPRTLVLSRGLAWHSEHTFQFLGSQFLAWEVENFMHSSYSITRLVAIKALMPTAPTTARSDLYSAE